MCHPERSEGSHSRDAERDSSPSARLGMTRAAIRIAALFVFLAGGIWTVTRVLVRRAEANFAARSAAHVDSEVRRIRGDVMQTETALDAAIARVAQRLAAKPSTSRAETFAMLRNALGAQPRQGLRTVAPNGEALAWWGE